MKVIILAAGKGTRLSPLTDDIPKCMVKINGISIIDRQIEIIKKCGILEKDICIVTGYHSEELIKHFFKTDIVFINNKEYDSTNMVYSLMCAKNIIESEDSIIISYGDIIYTKLILDQIINNKENASVVIDDGWKEYWEKRFINPLVDAETIVYDKKDMLLEIGKKPHNYNDIMAQYIGLIKFSGDGIRDMLNFWNTISKSKYGNFNIENYKKMYMTDFLQKMIENNYHIKVIHIMREWFEIDNIFDIYLAEEALK